MASKVQAKKATTATNVAENVVTNHDVKVKSIRVYDANGTIRYRVIFDKTIAGIVKVDENNYVEQDVDYVDFVPRHLIAQCIELIPGLGMLYNKKKETALRVGSAAEFGAAELQCVLNDAKITIERTKFVAGSEYTIADTGEVRTHEHDGYNSSIVDIVLSAKSQLRMDNIIDKLMLGF